MSLKANVRIDLSKIAPEIAKDLDEIREKVDELYHAAHALYMKLGFDLEAEASVIEEEKPE